MLAQFANGEWECWWSQAALAETTQREHQVGARPARQAGGRRLDHAQVAVPTRRHAGHRHPSWSTSTGPEQVVLPTKHPGEKSAYGPRADSAVGPRAESAQQEPIRSEPIKRDCPFTLRVTATFSNRLARAMSGRRFPPPEAPPPPSRRATRLPEDFEVPEDWHRAADASIAKAGIAQGLINHKAESIQFAELLGRPCRQGRREGRLEAHLHQPVHSGGAACPALLPATDASSARSGRRRGGQFDRFAGRMVDDADKIRRQNAEAERRDGRRSTPAARGPGARRDEWLGRPRSRASCSRSHPAAPR